MLITAKELCEKIGISYETLLIYVKEYDIPYTKYTKMGCRYFDDGLLDLLKNIRKEKKKKQSMTNSKKEGKVYVKRKDDDYNYVAIKTGELYELFRAVDVVSLGFFKLEQLEKYNKIFIIKK